MATLRIDELKARVSLADLIGQRVDLKKAGSELKGLCPFHKEKSPSFAVFTDATGAERYYCHGCGASGDHLDWLQAMEHLEAPEALTRLREIAGDGSPLVRKSPAKPKASKYTFIDPPPGEPPPYSIYSHKADGVRPVVDAWAYRDAAGALLGYTCRVEVDGKKEVIPVRWTAEKGWRQKSLEIPRPPYGAELLAANPGLNVIVAEGEKATDAGRRIMAGFDCLVITWAGGCGAVHHTDWSQLAGRQVVLWPDCDSKCYPDNHERAGEVMSYPDQPGMSAMLQIAELLQGLGCDVRIVNVPPPGTWPDGEDFADLEAKGWTQQDVLTYIKDFGGKAFDLFGDRQAIEVEEGASDGEFLYDDSAAPDFAATWDDTADHELPFRILGHNGTLYYYYTKADKQVVSLGISSHKAPNFFALARLSFWREHFPSAKKDVDWIEAAGHLIGLGNLKGSFNTERIRGRGAWWDDGRAVVNAGTGLIVDGEHVDYLDFDSWFIYTGGDKWEIDPEKAAGTQEAIKLLQILQAVHWERPINAHLAAGWAFLGPVGGALVYRPAIWISGASGVGKTTVQNGIIGRTMGGIRLYCAANTSEPGLRQKLGNDTIPVQFDEFEADNQEQARTIAEIERLVVQSATDDGAGIYKGGADGKPTRYFSRSMYCFCSIAVMIPSKAVGSRLSVLGLLPPEHGRSLPFDDLTKMIDATLTSDYALALQARAVALLPVIRHNAKVFAKAINIKFNEARMGDQYGTLLAGSYALHSSNEISLDKAIEWVNAQDWEEERQVYEEGDELKLLNYISGQSIRLQAQNGITSDYTIGELIDKCVGRHSAPDELPRRDAENALARAGLFVHLDTQTLWVSNSHAKLKAMLERTPWGHSWSRTLNRIPGAAKGEKNYRFAGTSTRYVMVPIGVLE